ncbi:MAG: nitrile hydratase subunit beta [Deltaproteobacteria bacterium]|nr:nitrile hydratase subunit beta [Deltaproteobacteria bacterium]MBI3387611.1 nitrile hydratase subunit beta [Deltaproteobacteria bacterium]
MDGIHDLGGMSGFGCVEVEPNEPVFHEPWERRVFGLNAVGIVVLRAYNADEYRHAIERMNPAHYLAASYYERVLTGVATLLVEKGVLTHDELEARAGGVFPLSRSALSPRATDVAQRVGPRFAVGEAVVVRTMHPVGHTRVPRYARGKRGVVIHVAPPFSFPDVAAHGLPQRSEPTYHVRFAARELWTDAAENNATVVVDLWESYLDAP